MFYFNLQIFSAKNSAKSVLCWFSGFRSQLHCQANSISIRIDFQNLDSYLLVQMHHLVRVFDVMVGHLADVDEAVLMHADVDKSAEGSDVGHDAVEGHPNAQVVDGADVFIEFEGFKRLSWVAARFVQLAEDVVDGLQTKLLLHEVFWVDLRDEFLVADKVFHLHVQRLGHLFHDVVTFWVNSALVQGILAIVDAQEAGALLKGLVAEARHFLELFAVLETAFFLAISDDVGCQTWANAADV